jgi:dTDP-4-amino-4,6-dideoxygalactose transaminase
MRLMRNFGFAGYDNVVHPGTNGKMIEASAAMGLTNLDMLDHFVAQNRERYDIYLERLGRIPGLEMVTYDTTEENNYHYIVASVEAPSRVSRDVLIDVLHAENILARKYFWPGCHGMQPYVATPTGPLPHTETIAAANIVLPSGPSLSHEDVHTICDIIEQACTAGIDAGATRSAERSVV